MSLALLCALFGAPATSLLSKFINELRKKKLCASVHSVGD